MKMQMRLLRYVMPHWRALGTVLATMILAVLLDVLRPWPTALLVDHVLGQKPIPAALVHVLAWMPGPSDLRLRLLLLISAATVLIFAIGALMSMAHTLASVGLGQRMAYDLGGDLFRHLERLSVVFHSRQPVGDTIARVTGDSYCVQSMVSDALLPLIQSATTVVTMFLIMWRLEPTITLLSLGVAPFLMLSIRMFGEPLKSRYRDSRDLEGEMMSLVEQSLTAIPAVQAFTREERDHARFREFADANVRAHMKAAFAASWFEIFTGLVTAVGTAAIIWLGAHYVLDGKMTAGTILVFIAYLHSLYEPLNSMTHTAATWQHAAADADRVMEILETPVEVVDAPDARDLRLDGWIRYEDVTFGYEPDRAVLKGISFEARPGEVVAIVGPTGAGKTTLVNLLVRFFEPWSGRITLDGEEIHGIRIRSLREQVGMVLQDPFLLPFTIAENIAYGRPEASREEVVAAAVAARADEFIRQLPDGYDTEIGERGATLSGGEKQRLSIARAFLKNATILVLDEPTSALDARTESFLLEALDRLMTGRTTLIIAHRLSTIRNADRILVLDRGEIVEQGRHTDLLARDGLYASLYRQQMEIAQHDFPPDLAVEHAI